MKYFILVVVLSSLLCLGLPAASYYKILGVPKTADQETIRKAYKSLAMKFHPDKNPHDKERCEKKFKEINEAYETLSNPEKRSTYDVGGDIPLGERQRGRQRPFQFPTSSSFSSRGSDGSYTFHQFEGGDLDSILREMFFSRNHRQPQNQHYSRSGFSPFGFQGFDPFSRSAQHSSNEPLYFECTLEELYRGAKKVFRVSDNVEIGMMEDMVIERVVSVDVKPGWKQGTRVTFPPTQQYPKAVTLVLKEAEHPYFVRQGDDLLWRCQLTPTQARGGVKIRLPLLSGETLELNTLELAGSLMKASRKEVVFRGRGMPVSVGTRTSDEADGRSPSKKFGDLIVTFQVG